MAFVLSNLKRHINEYHERMYVKTVDMLCQKGVTWRNTLKECMRTFEILKIAQFHLMHYFKWSFSVWLKIPTLLTDMGPNALMQFINVPFQITLNILYIDILLWYVLNVCRTSQEKALAHFQNVRSSRDVTGHFSPGISAAGVIEYKISNLECFPCFQKP